MPFGAISSIFNGALNASMTSLTNDENRAHDLEMWNKNSQLQREFAQNSIQWRVADAKKAGIHPLAALGSQGTSYTPQSSNFQAESPRMNLDFSSLADIKTRELQNKLLESQIETQRLENQARQKELDTPAGQSSSTVALPPKNIKKNTDIQGVTSKVVPQAQATAKPSHSNVPLIMRIEPTADEADKVESLGILNKINYWKDYHWDGESVAMAREHQFLERVSQFFKDNPDLDISDYDVVLRGDRLRGFQWQLERKPKKFQRTFVPKSGKGG